MQDLSTLLPLAIICVLGGAVFAVVRLLRARSGERRVAVASARAWPPPAADVGHSQVTASAQGGPSGFGGWLIFVVIGQTLAPIQVAIALVDIGEPFTQASLSSAGSLVAFAIVLMMIGLLIVTIWVAVRMWQRSRHFPAAFLYQWLASIIAAIVIIAAVPMAFGIGFERFIAIDGVARDFVRAVVGLIITGLWVWYVQTSLRVKNTFVR